MKSPSEIESLIANFIVNEVGTISGEDLSNESNLFAEGVLDSIAIMRLIAHIEDQLDTKIPPKDLVPKNFMTIKDMVDYLSMS